MKYADYLQCYAETVQLLDYFGWDVQCITAECAAGKGFAAIDYRILPEIQRKNVVFHVALQLYFDLL